MKKIIILFLILIVGLLSFFAYKKFSIPDDDLTKIKVAQVTHSIFYAPFYVAIEEGYFEENGLKIELILTPGADKVSSAVLSGDVQIGLAGSESTIYVYNAKEEDFLVSFSGLTKRDGQFIMSRSEIKDFTTKDLVGKHVLVGRKGGMPALSFENALSNTNIKSNSVNLDYSIEFAALAGAFIGGNGDFVNLFEPVATKLEKDGFAYVVGSVGELSGEVPYTTFYSRKSYINNNYETIKSFSKAIEKGLNFVEKNNAETTAKAILNQFPDSSLKDITAIVERYKKYDSWLNNSFISEKSFNNLQQMMLDAGQIETYTPYSELVNNILK